MARPGRRVATALLLGLLAGCARGTTASKGNAAPENPPPKPPTVTAEDIQRTPGQSIEEVLSNRFPGVVVKRAANGALIIQIRGATSFYGSSEPLYIIDDVPIEPGPGGSLSGINPYDIESIEVLKDAASTSMYGVRGANGVIIIKTKQTN